MQKSRLYEVFSAIADKELREASKLSALPISTKGIMSSDYLIIWLPAVKNSTSSRPKSKPLKPYSLSYRSTTTNSASA